MLAPVAPHMCEELWEIMGAKGFVSLAPWPTPDRAKIDATAEESETLIAGVLEDTLNIMKATGVEPKKIQYYVAAPWKWKAYLKAVEKSVSAMIQQRDLMKEMMADPALKAKAEKVAKFAGQIVDEVNRMPQERKQKLLQIGILREMQAMSDAEAFFRKEMKAAVQVFDEEDAERYDPKDRATLAKPYRPAIFIE
jgi:leucyl-tRNA synthetase